MQKSLTRQPPRQASRAAAHAGARPAIAQRAVVQRFGAIRFTNLDTTIPKYVEKAADIVATLQQAPTIQNFLANKNAVIILERNFSALATVSVQGEQVRVKMSPWFFEQESRGKIIGLLAHEFGVHPVANELLTGPQRNQENGETTNRTPKPTGVGTDTIAYDGSNQADHIHTAISGSPRFNVYQQTAYDLVSAMIANQAHTHITNAHITDTIMAYLADLAMILATNDHRGWTYFDAGKVAGYFTHVRAGWLAFLNGQPNVAQVTALTPGLQTGGDVRSAVHGVFGSFVLSLATYSSSDTRTTQATGAVTTTIQDEVLQDFNLTLQPANPLNSRTNFMRAIDNAQGWPNGRANQRVDNALSPAIATANPANKALYQRYLPKVQSDSITGVPDPEFINLLMYILPFNIRVLHQDGKLDTHNTTRPVNLPRAELVEVNEPSTHYRYAL